MIRSNKKCICKKCENCNFHLKWNMTNDKGEEAFKDKCGFFVLFDEITKIRGAVDGLQGGVNEARNRSMETRERIEDFGSAMKTYLKAQTKFIKLIGDK